LETLLGFNDRTAAIAEWLITVAARSLNEPLEVILDELFGTPTAAATAKAKDFSSPLYEYYFSPAKLTENPAAYLEFLSDIATLRRTLREYRPNEQLRLGDLLGMLDTYRDLGRSLRVQRTFGLGNRVKLLTAHKAKGQEFDTVFIINASSENWGEKSRSRSSKLPFPHNMPFDLPNDDRDGQIRLLFVAITRAKRQLFITSHNEKDGGKALLPVEYLLDDDLPTEQLSAPTIQEMTVEKKLAWHAPLVNTTDDLRDLLAETLENYRLSATHLNNFVDVSNGGAANFLMKNLLRFPEAKNPAAVFGTAVHAALQRAHLHLSARGAMMPLEDLLGNFTAALSNAAMTDRDYHFYHQRGIDSLGVFYEQRAASFSPEQIVERNLATENVVVDGVRLSGLIDLIDIDKSNKTLTVTDYKTGKAAKSWHGKTDYENIKLHKSRQQLLFYKLLLENSREFAGYTVERGILEFVEPQDGQIVRLEMTYDREGLAKFQRLIKSVWTRIMNLDLPDADDFSPDFAGILQFEDFLVKNP
jgi:DNA helicase-2/ATP-dependent DNA helicase PcrA